MSEFTTNRLKQLYNRLRLSSNERDPYESMQRLLPSSPITGDPYSTDQIWAWLHGADTAELDERLFVGGEFVQIVEADGRYYSFRMELPYQNDILSLLTTEHGTEVRIETAQSIMARRYGFRGDLKLIGIKPLNRYNPTHKEEVVLPTNYAEEGELEYVEDDVEDYYN